MRKSDQIARCLIRWCRGSSEVILPNFYFGMHECDVFRLTGSDLVIEYEIKISRADFFADFKKGWGGKGQKHERMKAKNESGPNRFFFVVPEGLVTVDEVPDYAGLIYVRDNYCQIVKSGKVIHKKKFTAHRSICITVSAREAAIRAKYNLSRDFDQEKEIARLNKVIDCINAETKETFWELQRLRRQERERLAS